MEVPNFQLPQKVCYPLHKPYHHSTNETNLIVNSGLELLGIRYGLGVQGFNLIHFQAFGGHVRNIY